METRSLNNMEWCKKPLLLKKHYMKVTLLKEMGTYKEGDVVDVDNSRGEYWIGVGIAKKGEKKEVKPAAKTTAAPTKKASTKQVSKKRQTVTKKAKR